MAQKIYKFRSLLEGKEIQKTLARPTNERITKFLNAIGKKNFSELLTPEGQMAYGIHLLDLALDMQRLKEMLAICIEESIDDIDMNPATFDITKSDEVIQDFFDQRGKTFLARKNGLTM